MDLPVWLQGVQQPGPYFEDFVHFLKTIKQLLTKSPVDLVRYVSKNSKISEVTVKNVRKSIFSMF